MESVLLAHAGTRRQLDQYINKPTHALSLCGDTGAGKGYLAHYLSAQLLNIDAETANHYPYLRSIDALDQKTGIDDIRELQKFLVLTVPGLGTIKRVVIVEHLDVLGHEAQNAFLKTLEEPPADTAIIVTYARATNLLPTIHSRLQSINVLPITQAQAEQGLPHTDDQKFIKAFYLSGGLIGLLSALLQNDAQHPLITAIEQARTIVSLPRYKRLGIVDTLAKNNDVSAYILLDGLYRLVDASYRHALKAKSNDELKNLIKRLSLIEQAMSDLDQNVQAKLVMSRLFLEL